MLPDFINKIIHRKKSEPPIFLSLEIKSNIAKAAVWSEKKGKIEIIGIGEKEISDNWEEIIQKVDLLISQFTNVPEEKIKDTIFAFPESWTEEGKIKKEILAHLKKLCSDLSLTPLGFVVINEAIYSEIQKQEGAPISAIILGLEKKEVSVDILRVGKNYFSSILSRDEGDISSLLAQALRDIENKEILPSRLIIYDNKENLEVLKQEIISYPWTKNSSFLHFPKVEILPSDFDIKAIVAAGGREIKSRTGIDLGDNQTGMENTPVEKPSFVKTESENPVLNQASDLLGFIKDVDILNLQVPKEEEKINKTIVPAVDYQREPPKKIAVHLPKVDFLLPFKKLLSFIKKILPEKKAAILLIIFLIIGSLGGIYFLYYTFAKANLKFYVASETLEKSAEIIVAPSIVAINLDKKEIPGKIIEIAESDKIKKSTTGEKLVGDKAKGQIYLYNKNTAGPKLFKAGVIIIGPSNKQFTLDEDVTIPPATDTGTGLTYGKIAAKLTASDIGEDYNLPSGKKDFSIKEYSTSSYAGIGEDAFTGGSSRKIKIVSEKDKTQLEQDLLEKLKNKGKADIENKINNEDKIIEKSINVVNEDKKLTPNVGNEASEVSLEEKAKFNVLAYKKSDMDIVVHDLAQKAISGNFQLNKEIVVSFKDSDISLDKTDSKIARYKINLTFKTSLVPKYNLEEIKNNLNGKNENYAKTYLNSLPNIKEFEAVLTPRLPNIFSFFPRNPKNINIEVIAK